ncbi:MAG: hypothetical protein PHW96_03620 [Candidatus Nanoarchaeia archaeon]|nr:hypothetical protein [Candidatus Nanoarchaeia archaeon]
MKKQKKRKLHIPESKIILAELILVLVVLTFVEAPKFTLYPNITPIIIIMSLLFVIVCAVLNPEILEIKKNRKYLGIVMVVISTFLCIWMISGEEGTMIQGIIETILVAMLYIGAFSILLKD